MIHNFINKYLKIIYIFIIINSTLINAASVSIVIDQPGLSGFGVSRQANPTDVNDAFVRIQTSDLILDLGGAELKQANGNTISGFDGIVIDAGLRNIEIRNGVIGPVTGRGIYIGDGCSQISIKNVTVKQCAATGILCDGNLTGSGISALTITKCLVLSCTGSNGNPAYGLRMINCSRCEIKESNFNFNDSGAVSRGTGISLESCSFINVEHSKTIRNGGFQFGMGLFMDQCTACNLTEVVSSNNLARDATLTSSSFGFLLNGCTNITLESCYALNNRHFLNNGIGFQTQDGSGQTFLGCIAKGNTGRLGVGFLLTGTEANTELNLCKSFGNRGGAGAAGRAYGLFLSGAQDCIISKNVFSGNTANIAYGLRENTINTNNFIAGNTTYKNTTTGFDVPRTVGTFSVAYANAGDFSQIQNISEYINVAIG